MMTQGQHLGPKSESNLLLNSSMLLGSESGKGSHLKNHCQNYGSGFLAKNPSQIKVQIQVYIQS